jgi:hypothetical protein
MWVSLNGDSLPRANTSLITLSSKIQNTNMIWDGTTTIHNNWGTFPTEIAPLSIFLKLEITADSIFVYPLDSKGKESNFSVLYPSQPGIFSLFIDQNISKTLWFGIERFSKFSEAQDNQATIMNYDLEQNYPNPFNGHTTFKYVLPKESTVSFVIYDILGRRIKFLLNQKIASGTYNISWDGKNENGKEVVSGIYFANFVSDNFISTKKMIMLK